VTSGENSSAFHANHLPFTAKDFRILKLVVENWVTHGFTGNLNTESAGRGYITFITPIKLRETRAHFGFEIHKLRGRKFLFWQTKKWVAQLFTCQSEDGAFSEINRCVGLRYGLMSTLNAVISGDKDGARFACADELENNYAIS
jgi:hypothetical protein